MKTLYLAAALSAFVVFKLNAQTSPNAANPTPAKQTPAAAFTAYHVTDQGPNQKIWQSESSETLPDGRIVTHVRKFTELATGLSFQQTPGGPWLDSKEEIDIQSDGSAVANQGPHQVHFPADIFAGVIELTTPDGKVLHSQPAGLSYDDGNNTVLIAVLTNSVGYVVNANQVIYPNAFSGIRADLRFTYTKAGLEQDVILKQRPPDPASLNLNGETTKLQMLTEFIDPPQPEIATTAVATDAGDSTDDELNFGTMQMGRGKAFLLGAHWPAVPVNKHWVRLDGRQFLVEEVPMVSMAEEMQNLPLALNHSTAAHGLYAVSNTRRLPSRPNFHASGKHMLKMAKKSPQSPALVMDYQMVSSSSTNFIFQGDSTYYISGSINLYGTNVFEGGTVLKFGSGAGVTIIPHAGFSAAIVAHGSAYRPIVFTAKDDNSVGDPITGSTGSPSGYYGTMLDLVGISPAPTLSGLRMSYASTGISCIGVSLNLYDSQFINCGYGFQMAGTVKLRNVLFSNVQTTFNLNGGCLVDAQNTTFSGDACIGQGISIDEGNSMVMTNCIFSNDSTITNEIVGLNGNFNGFYQSPEFGGNSITNPANPFQTVGTGSFYSANGCNFTNSGTTNIDPVLLADIAVKTTHPPILYSNVTFSVATNFSPQALRDTSASPDLGYHYDPLDYIFGNVSVTTNLTFTAGTAVGWFDSSGFGMKLSDGINVSYGGTITAPCVFALYSTVQEGNGLNWTGSNPTWYGMAATGSDPVSANSALISPQFTHFYSLALTHDFIRDYSAVIRMWATDSEFYSGAVAGYAGNFCMTNCLFDRMYVCAQAECCAQILLLNDTFHGGLILDNHWGTWYTTITNCAFDGTSFSMDSLDTTCDYNAFVTNAARLPFLGTHDVIVTNFNWQSSWFGNFYLPTNSPIIDHGNTTADQVGLYHFTTQTNQIPETNSLVDIGYHYVAADTNGVPLDTDGDGVPDYIEDANGNGVYDVGDTGDWQSSLGIRF